MEYHRNIMGIWCQLTCAKYLEDHLNCQSCNVGRDCSWENLLGGTKVSMASGND